VFAARTRSHRRILSATADVVVEITSGRQAPSRYSVVLRTFHEGAWRTVRSFDNAHDGHDEHRYTREGEKLPAGKFCDGDAKYALGMVFAYLDERWQGMIDEWLR
jgi:hypothetical protein